MYCHCGFSFDRATKVDAPADWQARQAWRCDRCGKLHHAVQEEHQVVRGPADAISLLNATGRSTGIHYLSWRTESGPKQTIEYHPYPREIPMSHPEPLLFSLWELLQSKMSLFMEYEPDDNMEKASARERAQYEARGIAETLAIIMQPFVNPPEGRSPADTVVMHAVAYYKDNTYEVPGLGLYLWDPMKNADGTDRTPMPTPTSQRKPAPARKLGKQLDAAETEAVKAALTSGMFTAEQLAGVYKVSVTQIEALK